MVKTPKQSSQARRQEKRGQAELTSISPAVYANAFLFSIDLLVRLLHVDQFIEVIPAV